MVVILFIGSRSKSSVGCKCETGCSSDLCMCCVRGGTCTEGECLCINCRNPLNILHQLGLPVHRARTDPCLMENIYQVGDFGVQCCHYA